MKKQNISSCFPSLCIHEINFPSCPLFFFRSKLFLTDSHSVYIQKTSIVLSFPLWFFLIFSFFLCCCLPRQICFLYSHAICLRQLYIENHQFRYYLFRPVSYHVTADKMHQQQYVRDVIRNHYHTDRVFCWSVRFIVSHVYLRCEFWFNPKDFKSTVYFLLVMASGVCRMFKCMSCVLKVCIPYISVSFNTYSSWRS